MPKSDAQLLREYAEEANEAAFREIVVRHTDLVYSAGLRQINSPDLARDVAQNVFADLARKARPVAKSLAENSSLVGWLYRATRFEALNVFRDQRRREARERQAMEEFPQTPDTALEWDRLRPVLDDAMAALNDADREALLLRYFRNQDLREVGIALRVSDGTAQKRVSRALEKLREKLSRHGITTAAGTLTVVISAYAVQAAPVGLAVTISAATIAGTTLATTATATTVKSIAMTTLQKTIIGATLVVAVGTGIYEARQASVSRVQIPSLQQQQQALAEQIEHLTRERDSAASQLTALQNENTRLYNDNARLSRDTAELPKLRGEVTQLRQSKAPAASSDDPFTQSVLALTQRAGELNQHLQRMPDKKIPELQFLTESDWLSVAKDASFQSEADVRQALSKLRNVAKAKFGTYATHALDKFIAANNGQLPMDLFQLNPYFEVPVEDAILQRYQVLQSGEASNPRDNWLLREKAPVDRDYELPLHVKGWAEGGG